MSEKEIIAAISQLAKEGEWSVFLVGGYLRDRILHRVSHDLDFVVEGDAVAFAKAVARRLSLRPPVVYGRFGTAMLSSATITLEFATARKESYLAHSRKPKVFASTIEDDLARRDFTINTLALSLRDQKIIDLFGAREDIKNRIIRTPVDPDRTFFDDPLRMLRAVRFATHLNFAIHPETAAAIIRNRERLKIVSSERAANEFLRIMDTSRPAAGIAMLDGLKLLPYILPEIENLKNVVAADDRTCKDVFRHTLIVLEKTSKKTKDLATRLASLFHDVGKPSTQRYLPGIGWTFHDHPIVGRKIFVQAAKRLGIGNPVRDKAARLIEYHLRPHYLAGVGTADQKVTNRAIAHLVHDAGADIKSLFILARADLTSKNPVRVSKGLADIDRLEQQIKEWKRNQRRSVFRLALDGNEIMHLLGITPGRQVGQIKSQLEQLVLSEVLPNRKRDLRKYLKENWLEKEAQTAPKNPSPNR